MSETRYDVLCAGILVADLFAPPLPRLPAAGELLRVDEMLLSTGGCAANTGIDLARLGARVAVAGKVGQDVFANFIVQDLAARGLDTAGVSAAATAPTSRTIILPVRGEDRRYIHMVGANAGFTPGDIDLGLVARSRVLYVGGYQLCPGFDQAGTCELFRFARSHGCLTVLDVAGVDAAAGLAPFKQVLACTDAFLPNDDEARLITGEEDAWRQARCFLDLGAGTVVVTLGSRGALAGTREGGLAAGTFPVEVADPSGAGDAFAAGFILGMLEGWDLPRTLTFASAIGASACRSLGTTAGVFDRPQALDFLARHALPLTRLAP